MENGPVELPIRTYVVRECDQIVASVHIEEKKMVLGVWNMTEKQFIDKYKTKTESHRTLHEECVNHFP